MNFGPMEEFEAEQASRDAQDKLRRQLAEDERLHTYRGDPAGEKRRPWWKFWERRSTP